LIELKIHKQV